MQRYTQRPAFHGMLATVLLGGLILLAAGSWSTAAADDGPRDALMFPRSERIG